MKKSRLLLIIILVTCFNSKAQQLSDSIGNHLLMHGSEIPGNRFIEIAADSKGNIYAASRIGIVKWDGNSWHQYKVYDEWGQHTLLRIALDNSDGVWVITEGHGFIKFDNNSLKGINTGQYCYDMVACDSFMYGSAYKHLIKFNPATLDFQIIGNDADVTALHLHLDNRGNIWGTCMFDDRIFQLQNDTIILHPQINEINAADILFISVIDTNYYALITKTYPYYKLYNHGVYSDIPPPLTGNYSVGSFLFLPDSTLSLASSSGAFLYKSGLWTQLGDKYTNAICSISADTIAIAFEHDGISMGTAHKLTNYKGPALDEIHALAYYNNTLFLGSFDGYVSQWNGSEITTAGTSDPLFYGCRQLRVSPDNKLYASGRAGVYRYFNNQWESLNKLYKLPEVAYFKCAINSNNRLYLGSYYNGLYIADSTGLVEHYHSGNSPIYGYVGGLLYDRQERLWMGMGDIDKGDVYTLENNRFIHHEIPIYTGAGYPLSMLEDSKGNIWVGYMGTDYDKCSLLRYNGTQWDSLHYENEIPWMGNSSQPIMDIYEDYKGNIWIASSITYMYDGMQWHRFNKTFTVGSGSTFTYAITGDGKGNIFLGTAELGTYVLSYDHTGIIEQKARKLQELSLYPNPTKGALQIALQHAGESTLNIYNAQGRLVYTTKAHSIRPNLNLRHLAKGQYIINVLQSDYFGSASFIKE